MSSQSPACDLSNLTPDLFPLIANHVPLIDLPSALLSLALTSRRLCEIVIPDLLYRQVSLSGEEEAISVLRGLAIELQRPAEAVPRSHRIHQLSIDCQIITPVFDDEHSLQYLYSLIAAGGLPNLVSLTLRVSSKWVEGRGDAGVDYIDRMYVHPSSFWDGLRESCPRLNEIQMNGVWQKNSIGNQWIQNQVFPQPNLTSIRVEGYWYRHGGYLPVNPPRGLPLDFSRVSPSLQTLDFRMKESSAALRVDACCPGGLLASSNLTNLRTLVLDAFVVTNPTDTRQFWKNIPELIRLELYDDAYTESTWFKDFDSEMLPNLQYLTCGFSSARAVLPYVSQRLISLHITRSCNAQGVYLLRAIAEGGQLPALRSLGIQRSEDSLEFSTEGEQWQEPKDANGAVEFLRGFNADYIKSISKAAPNLEELQLMGRCDKKLDLNSLTSSLSLIPKLRRLLLSGSAWLGERPFFYSSYTWPEYNESKLRAQIMVGELTYAPESFEQAARDLAEGCRTLEEVTMTNHIGEFYVRMGERLSARIVRESMRGPVKGLRRIRAWGSRIGREDWW